MSKMTIDERFLHDLKKVKKLNHTQHCYIAWSENQGAEVWNLWGGYFLFVVPLIGDSIFVGSYTKDGLAKLVAEAYSWA